MSEFPLPTSWGMWAAVGPEETGWTPFSNHGKVLLCIACDPEIRVADIARSAGIKERAVQRILADLRADSVIRSTRAGRRNRYEVDLERRLGWAPNGDLTVRDLVRAIGS
jgi:DNA-binding IclR family transcriptional regulator